MCTDEVKTALFRAYCTPLYTAHLWCNHSKAKMNNIKVAYNDALRILLKYPKWESASKMFVNCNVPTFQALLRNVMFKFMCRLIDSRNGIIISLTDPTQSETRYFSSFWKYWNQHVYVERKWKEIEKGLMNGKFTLKSLSDSSGNRTKVICMYCWH